MKKKVSPATPSKKERTVREMTKVKVLFNFLDWVGLFSLLIWSINFMFFNFRDDGLLILSIILLLLGHRYELQYIRLKKGV